MRGLWFTVWAVSCIGLGLLVAYADGIGIKGIIGSATVMSLVIVGVIASTYVFHALKRKRPPKH